MVESGPDNSGLPAVAHPALYRATLAPGTANAFHYKSREEEALSGREVIVTIGGILGGGSSVNGMIYQRGQLCDFDSWDSNGCSGNETISEKGIVVRKINANSEDQTVPVGNRLANRNVCGCSSRRTTLTPATRPMDMTARCTYRGGGVVSRQGNRG